MREQRSDLRILGGSPWEMLHVEQLDPASHSCRQNSTTLQYKSPRIYKPQLRLPALIHKMRHSTEHNCITELAREIAMVTHHSLVLGTTCSPLHYTLQIKISLRVEGEDSGKSMNKMSNRNYFGTSKCKQNTIWLINESLYCWLQLLTASFCQGYFLKSCLG